MAHLSVTQALAGFFAAIGLYNTLIYFATSDRAFLWYAVLMNTVAGVQFVFAPHLIGVAPGDALVVYRTAIFALFFCAEVIFAWTFLRISTRFPKHGRVLAAILAANIIALGLDRVLGHAPVHRIIDHALFLALLGTCAAAAWAGTLSGHDDARYFFIGYAGALTGALGSAVSEFAGLPAWAVYFFQGGLIWQSALLTIAIGSRYFKLDPLTGVKSRRAFEEGLQRAYRAAVAKRAGLAVIIVSIHALKEYEGRFGRLAGDTMMRKVANVCATCCRDRADVFARYGDEAFAALIPRITLEGAKEIAQRIRDTVENTCSITVGVGVGCIEEARSAKGITQRAAQRSARDAIGRGAVPEGQALA